MIELLMFLIVFIGAIGFFILYAFGIPYIMLMIFDDVNFWLIVTVWLLIHIVSFILTIITTKENDHENNISR